MTPLDQQPTLETDAMLDDNGLRCACAERPIELCYSLERRLALCREALEGSQWLLTTECDEWHREAKLQAEINAETLANSEKLP